MNFYTRQDYLDKKCSHEAYYGQYVDDDVRKLVLNRFPLHHLLEAGENFEGIPDQVWDFLTMGLDREEVYLALQEHGDFWTLYGAVCILKEAARQILQR